MMVSRAQMVEAMKNFARGSLFDPIQEIHARFERLFGSAPLY